MEEIEESECILHIYDAWVFWGKSTHLNVCCTYVMLLDSWRGFWVLQVLENRSHKYYSLGATSIREYVEFMEDSDLAINFNPWEYVDSFIESSCWTTSCWGLHCKSPEVQSYCCLLFLLRHLVWGWKLISQLTQNFSRLCSCTQRSLLHLLSSGCFVQGIDCLSHLFTNLNSDVAEPRDHIFEWSVDGMVLCYYNQLQLTWTINLQFSHAWTG